jgi:hypothetical protein
MTSFNSLHDRSSAFGAAENAGLRVQLSILGWRLDLKNAANTFKIRISSYKASDAATNRSDRQSVSIAAGKTRRRHSQPDCRSPLTLISARDLACVAAGFYVSNVIDLRPPRGGYNSVGVHTVSDNARWK